MVEQKGREVVRRLRSWNGIPDLTPEAVVDMVDYDLPSASQAPRPLLAYGNGRSYGDVCLTDEGTLLTTRWLDHFISFDTKTGIVRCQSGVQLQDILKVVVPHGWFLPSTPGSRFVTVGGAVANDVHGKNHHDKGCFGHHVRALELVRSNGDRMVCSPEQNSDFFYATIGGLGLTGLISWVEIQLMPVSNEWMWVRTRRFSNLDEFWQLNAEAESLAPYTYAWIDCLAKGRTQGRGILMIGEHASDQTQFPGYKERPLNVPVQPPISLINAMSLRLFNEAYYRQPTNPNGALHHYKPYFYPLDMIKNWNRIYGPKGFYQYQCVLPPEVARPATSELLDAIAGSGQGSFLVSLKTFGSIPSIGMLSFPRPGATLALDFPNRGENTLQLFKRLDDIVSGAGGALYPGKDARMPASLFKSGYPEWQRFSNYVDEAFSSHFWRRVSS